MHRLKKILVGKPVKENHFGDLKVNSRIILKRILKKHGMTKRYISL
jgi:hypothetical protein